MAAKSKKSRLKAPKPASQKKIGEPALSPQEPAVIILNPTAGHGRAAKTWASIRSELRYWRTLPRVIETDEEGHATELALAAVAHGSSLIIAAGGDGTAHEVVQGIMEAGGGQSGVAFAHLPLGTGCDLATGLGLPRNPVGMLRKLRKGRDLHIDVGVADLSRHGDTVRRYFFNAANIGLGPAVARRLRDGVWYRSVGTLAYSLATMQELLTARPHQISWLTDDGRAGETLVLNLVISNGPSVAGGMRPNPDAGFDTGMLHLAMIGALSLPAALSQLSRVSRNRLFDHADIEQFTCRSIEIKGPEIDVETDGEIAGGLPARIWVRPAALLVRMPA